MTNEQLKKCYHKINFNFLLVKQDETKFKEFKKKIIFIDKISEFK